MARPNFQVRVAGVSQLSDRVREYLLVSDDGLPLPPYSAGAHIALHTHSVDRGLIVRHYSLVGGSDLNDDARHTYRIAVQRENHARGSAHIHATFEVGTRMEIGPPTNNFPLDRGDKNVLLIAGGIGITPIFSMARSLQRRRCDYRVFYAGRRASDMAYHDQLQNLAGDKARLHYSEAQGTADLQHLLRSQPRGTRVYVCGPRPMIEATHAAGVALGWPADSVRTEMFTAVVSGDTRAFTVHLQRSGKRVQVGSDTSILDALVAEGLPVLWDCRRGECGLCPLPVVRADGGIEHHDHYLTSEEKESGQALCICVSRVRGSELVLDA